MNRRLRTVSVFAALMISVAAPVYAQTQTQAPAQGETPAQPQPPAQTQVPVPAPAQSPAPVQAMPSACGNDGTGFPAWLEDMKKDAAAQGIGAQALAALDGVAYDEKVIARDRTQGKTFKQTFEQFSGRMVNDFRIRRGKQVIKKYQAVFDRAEAEYGVQAPMIVALWALETDFGVNVGKFDTIRSLATLAYDCRRPNQFRKELLSALKIIDEGDMPVSEMKGAWAGEIGQVQFLPSNYLKRAVDFDGDGRKDLIKSQADVIGSVAKFLADAGWQRGAGWDEGQPNFVVLKAWNGSELYRKTIALLADRIAAN